MTATNHTEHYGLSQYTENDRPTYTGDYNSDMSKIDAAIRAAARPGGMVDALSSRVTILERQVSALTASATPSATGLTATQLDTQYSDDYNIVRIGTPVRSNESEGPHHE